LNASIISGYDVASLSRLPSCSTAVLKAVINLSNFGGMQQLLSPILSWSVMKLISNWMQSEGFESYPHVLGVSIINK
jgi:hypothetical protein